MGAFIIDTHTNTSRRGDGVIMGFIVEQNLPTPIICSVRSSIIAGGIFHGGDLFDKTLQVFLMQVIAISVVSHSIHYLLRPLKQPKFVCNVLAGILISPYITGRKRFFGIKPFPIEEIIVPKVWAYFGMAYFVFLTAVKMDLTVILRTLKSATIIGFSGIGGSFMVVMGMILALSLPGVKKDFFQVLMAVSLSLTLFPNVAYTFSELNILSSDLGQLAMSSSMVSEAFSWMYVVVRLYYGQVNHTHSVAAILSALAFIAFILFVVRPLVQVLIKKVPEGKPVEESYVVVILVGALLGAFVADLIGALHLGVLLLGLVIPTGPPLGSILTKKAEFVVTEIIVPMFYVIVGADVDLSRIDAKVLVEVFFLVFVGAVGKFAAALSAALFCNLKFQHALLLGLMLNVKGPFDLYAFIKWKGAREVTTETFAVLVIAETAITAIVTPLIDILYGSFVRVNAVDVKRNMTGLYGIPRHGELKVLCCIHNEENVPGIVVLLKATNPTINARLCVHVVHLRELAGQATPMLVSYGSKLKRVESKRSNQIMQAFDNYLNDLSGAIKVNGYSVVAPFKNMHEYVCSLAKDRFIPLIIVPFHETLTELDPTEAASLRNLNIKVQALAPCTVGMLVDKSGRQNMSLPTFHYNIAVIFICGADDREALSLAIRMSSHPAVSITVLQFVVKDLHKNGLEAADLKLDRKLIKKFKASNANNAQATYRKVESEDAEGVLNEIRGLKGKHNLIMVGRQRQGMKSLFDEQMLSWSEHPELGVIGDYLSSSDFCNGQTSVLVMQHYSDIKGSTHHCSYHGGENC